MFPEGGTGWPPSYPLAPGGFVVVTTVGGIGAHGVVEVMGGDDPPAGPGVERGVGLALLAVADVLPTGISKEPSPLSSRGGPDVLPSDGKIAFLGCSADSGGSSTSEVMFQRESSLLTGGLLSTTWTP
jgi:hypothetical protein